MHQRQKRGGGGVKPHQTAAAVPSRDKAFAVTGTAGWITGTSAGDAAPGVAPAGLGHTASGQGATRLLRGQARYEGSNWGQSKEDLGVRVTLRVTHAGSLLTG